MGRCPPRKGFMQRLSPAAPRSLPRARSSTTTVAGVRESRRAVSAGGATRCTSNSDTRLARIREAPDPALDGSAAWRDVVRESRSPHAGLRPWRRQAYHGDARCLQLTSCASQ
jgi:hypothetical protein